MQAHRLATRCSKPVTAAMRQRAGKPQTATQSKKRPLANSGAVACAQVLRAMSAMLHALRTRHSKRCSSRAWVKRAAEVVPGQLRHVRVDPTTGHV
jgi:hypothetical protein